VTPRLAYPVALVTGALLTLAFPEPDVAAVTWFVLAPSLYLTRGVGAKRGALVWAVFGLGFFGTLLTWVSVVGWLAWGVLLVVQTPFVAGFGALWGSLSAKTGPLGRIGLAAGAWALFEYLRSVFPVGGFTWGQLAQSQHDMAWLLSWASVGGGVMFAGLLVGANACLAEIAAAVRSKAVSLGDVGRIIAPVLFLVVFAAGPTAIRVPSPHGSFVHVALVQGNVNPLVPQDFEKDLRILKRHVALTERLDFPDGPPGVPRLVIWPESAAAIDPDEPVVPPLLERAATAADAPMIVGGSEDVGDRSERYTVMAFLVSPKGEILDRYQKTHLVPFGEYVPARELLDWMPILDQVPRDAVPGDRANVFRIAGGTVATVLSFEGDFGSLVRKRVAAGGRLIVVGTNTSTWRHSWASAQHVAFSQVRAVENGVPVVHAALSGISAFISSHGRVMNSLGLYEEGSMIQTLRFATSITPYARYGEWVLASFVALCAAVWSLGRARTAKVASADA